MDSKTHASPKSSRRGFVIGAGITGAAAAAVATMPAIRQQAAVQPAPELKPAPEKGGGYQLSEHVKRYYKTTRV